MFFVYVAMGKDNPPTKTFQQATNIKLHSHFRKKHFKYYLENLGNDIIAMVRAICSVDVT